MRGVVVAALLAAGCGKHPGASSEQGFLATAKLRDLAFQLGADDTVALEFTFVDHASKPILRLPGVVSVEVELEGGASVLCKAVTSVEGSAVDEKGHVKLVTPATHVNGGPCNRELLAAQFSGPASWHIRASYMGSSTENVLKLPSFAPSAR